MASAVLLALGCGASPDRERELNGAERWLAWVHPELRHRPKPVGDAENALALWSALDAEALTPRDAELEEFLWEAHAEEADFPEGERGKQLREWLDSRRAHLAIIDAGIARGQCRFSSMEVFATTAVELQRAALIKVIQAKRLAADGDFLSARKQVRGIVKLSEMVREADAAVVGYLLSTALESGALGAMRWLAARKGAPDRLLGELGIPAENDAAFARAWRVELCGSLLSGIAALPEEGDPVRLAAALVREYPDAPDGHIGAVRSGIAKILEGHPRAFDKPATVKLASDIVLKVVRDAREPWPERDRGLGKDILEATEAWPEALRPANLFFGLEKDVSQSEIVRARDALRAVDNPVGKLHLRSLFDFPLFGGGLAESSRATLARQQAERAATGVIVKLLLYERRHGELPPALDALSEVGLLTSPADPFGSGSLRYSSERRLIWSVGPDGRDDEGVDLEDEQQDGTALGGTDEEERGDLVWRVLELGS